MGSSGRGCPRETQSVSGESLDAGVDFGVVLGCFGCKLVEIRDVEGEFGVFFGGLANWGKMVGRKGIWGFQGESEVAGDDVEEVWEGEVKRGVCYYGYWCFLGP